MVEGRYEKAHIPRWTERALFDIWVNWEHMLHVQYL